jgi:hypothetical protein
MTHCSQHTNFLSLSHGLPSKKAAYLAIALQFSNRNALKGSLTNIIRKFSMFLAKFEFSADPPTSSHELYEVFVMARFSHSRSTAVHQCQHHHWDEDSNEDNHRIFLFQISQPNREILPGWRRCGGVPCGSWHRRARRRASAPA